MAAMGHVTLFASLLMFLLYQARITGSQVQPANPGFESLSSTSNPDPEGEPHPDSENEPSIWNPYPEGEPHPDSENGPSTWNPYPEGEPRPESSQVQPANPGFESLSSTSNPDPEGEPHPDSENGPSTWNPYPEGEPLPDSENEPSIWNPYPEGEPHPDSENGPSTWNPYPEGEPRPENNYWNVNTTQRPNSTTMTNLVQGCDVGELRNAPGRVRSPGYPNNYTANLKCGYLITVPWNKRASLRFDDLSLERSPNCKYDNVRVFDGTDASSRMIRDPVCYQYRYSNQGNLTGSTNQLFVQFESDDSVQGRGFQFTYFASEPLCGGELIAENGFITSPTPRYYSREYPNNIKCLWKIRVPSGKSIQLDFMTFDLEKCPDNDVVRVYRGDVEQQSALQQTYCGSTIPYSLTIDSDTALISMTTDSTITAKGFRLSFTAIFQTNCGYELTDPEGSITTEGSGNYLPDRFCQWIIEVDPNDHVVLNVTQFDLEYSENCQNDYVEIIDGRSAGGPLLWRSCGSQSNIPEIASHSNQVSIRFKSDDTNQASGFNIGYRSVSGCGAELTALSGIIQSPNFMRGIPGNTSCFWNITMPEGLNIRITPLFIDVGNRCYGSSPIIEYGYYDVNNYNRRYRYCHQLSRNNYTIPSNIMWVKFTSRQALTHRGIRIKYEFDCDKVINVNRAEDSGVIQSPGFPNPFNHSITCSWRLQANSGSILSLEFAGLNFTNCDTQQLSVRASDYTLNDTCGLSSLPQPMSSFDNRVIVNYTSGPVVQDEGFRLLWTTRKCEFNLVASSGTFQSPNYPDTIRSTSAGCTWNITASPGYSVVVDFEDYGFDVHRCYSSILIQDNRYSRYSSRSNICGRLLNNSRIYTSQGNSIIIHLRNIYRYEVHYGMKLKASYYFVCGGSINADNSGSITRSYHSDDSQIPDNCTWTLTTSQRSRKVFVVIENLDIGTSAGDCTSGALEVKKDNDDIIRLCGNTLPGITTYSARTINIKFETLAGLVGTGFRIRYYTMVPPCGGDLTLSRGQFTSPNYPSNYFNNKVCEWKISTAPSTFVQLTFNSFNLEYQANCNYDYVKIYNGLGRFSTPLATICNTLIRGTGLTYTSSSNEMLVKFKTDSSVTRQGFNATYIAIPGCGDQLTGTSGTFTSPNYNGSTGYNNNCQWIITVQQGKAIKLIVEDFDNAFYPTCSGSGLQVYAGSSSRDRRLTELCHKRIFPETILSNSHEMFITYRSVITEDRGFMLRYEQVDIEELCGLSITGASGVFTSASNPNQCAQPQTQLYQVTVNDDRAVAIWFTPQNPHRYYPSGRCEVFRMIVYDGESDTDPVIGSSCYPTSNFRSTGNKMLVKVTNGNSINGNITNNNSTQGNSINGNHLRTQNFTARFTEVCYHVISATSGGVKSPNYPRSYPNNMECDWVIITSPGLKLNLTFVDIDLNYGSSSCLYNSRNSDHLQIFDGSEFGRPTTLCGTTSYISTSNRVVIRMTTDGSEVSRGFKLDFTSVCGGHLRADNTGYINSPNWPEPYETPIDCTWTITTSYNNRRVIMRFIALDLPGTAGSCDEDYVSINLGSSDAGASPDQRHCGRSHQTNALISNGNRISITFRSSDNQNSSGFRVHYNSEESPCLWNVTSPRGNLSSPNHPASYPNNKNCWWYIQAPPGSAINLTFTAFNLESAHNCVYDYLRIYDGSSRYGDRLASLCSRGMPTPSEYVSTTNLMILNFRTDMSVRYTGFSAKYSFVTNTICGNVLTDSSGTITFPTNTGQCESLIMVTQGHKVRLSITDLGLGNGSCVENNIKIYDGSDANSTLLSTVCPESATDQMTFTSTGHHLFIQMNAQSQLDDGHIALNAHYITLCGDRLTAGQGSLSASSEDGSSSACLWEIVADSGKTIRLNVDELHIMPTNCTDTWLKVYDGSNLSSPMLMSYCISYTRFLSTQSSLPIYSTTNFMYVELRGGAYSNFRANYTTVDGCSRQYSNPSGMIFSPYYPYQNTGQTNCEWKITSDESSFTEIIFVDFDVGEVESGDGCGQDFVQIYDGPGNNSDSLAILCGPLVTLPWGNSTNFVQSIGSIMLHPHIISAVLGGTLQFQGTYPRYNSTGDSMFLNLISGQSRQRQFFAIYITHPLDAA